MNGLTWSWSGPFCSACDAAGQLRAIYGPNWRGLAGPGFYRWEVYGSDGAVHETGLALAGTTDFRARCMVALVSVAALEARPDPEPP